MIDAGTITKDGAPPPADFKLEAPLGSLAKGPRPKRIDNPRKLGSLSHPLAPKDARKARNKAQRQARKANR